MQKNNIFFFVLALVLASGCISPEKTEELRWTCTSLASVSFAAVPDCDSENACFQKVEQMLFGFDSSALDFESRRLANQFKNFVSQSWWQYNQSQNALQKIRAACTAGQYTELPVLVNQLSHSMVGAFQNADHANEYAILFVVHHKDWLEQQQIGLVREDALFSDLVVLQNNVNELQTKQKPLTPTLTSRLMYANQKISSIFENEGLHSRFVSTEKLADAVPQHQTAILNALASKQSLIPIVGDTVFDWVRGLLDQQRLNESVSRLQRFPAFSFFGTYRELVGTQDSVAFEFARLVLQLSEHHANTNQKIMQLQTDLHKKIQEELIQLEQIPVRTPKELEYLQTITTALKPQTRVSLLVFETTDLAHSQMQMQHRLLEIKQQLLKTGTLRDSGQLSTGKMLAELYVIQSRLEEWLQNQAFLAESLATGLVIPCQERLSEIENELEKPSSTPTGAQLRAQTLFAVKSFQDATQTSDQIKYCAQSLNAFLQWETFNQDRAVFENQLDQKTKSCFDFLDLAFQTENAQLSDLEWNWETVQSQFENTQTVPGELAANCLNLQAQVKNQLLNSDFFAQIQQQALQTENAWMVLSQLGFENTTDAIVFKEKIDWVHGFFSNNQLQLEKIMNDKTEILKTLQKYRKEFQEQTGNELARVLAKTVSSHILSQTVPYANQSNETMVALLFSNPTTVSWAFAVPVIVNKNWHNARLVQSPTHIKRIEETPDGLIVFFDFVPPGISEVRIQTNTLVTTSQKTDFLLVNQFKAVLHQTISFQTDSKWPKLGVKTILPSASVSNVSVVFENALQTFSKNNDQITFELENVDEHSHVDVFFTVLNPFLVDQQVSSENGSLEWKMTVQNQLGQTIPKTFVELDVNPNQLFFLNAVDETGKSLSVIETNEQIKIVLDDVEPGEIRVITITAGVDAEQNLLESVLVELEKELVELSNNSVDSIKKASQQLQVALFNTRQKTVRNAKTVFELQAKVRELKENAAIHALDEQQFLEARLELQTQLGIFESLVSSLKAKGFTNAAHEVDERLKKAGDLLGQADVSFKSQNVSSALSTVSKGIATLKDGTIRQRSEFEQKATELHEKASELEKSIQQFALSEPLAIQIQRELVENRLKLKESLLQTNPVVLLQTLVQFEEWLEQKKAELNQFLESKTKQVSEQIQQIKKGVFEDQLRSPIQRMLDWFDKTDEKKLAAQGVFVPVSTQILKNRLNRLDKIKNEKLVAAIRAFDAAFESKDLVGALGIARKNEALIEKTIEELQALGNENQSDWDAVKQKAFVAIDQARVLADQGKLDSKQAALILKAQEAFEKDDFVQALLLAKQVENAGGLSATGFFGLTESIPIALVPVFLGIGALGLFRWRQKNKKTTAPVKIKIERVQNEL